MTVRYMRKTAIMAQIEATYGGGAPVAWGGSDLVLIRKAKFTLARDTEARELVTPWLGGSEHMVAARRAEIEFEVELAGSGAAGTPPAWGKLLRACGMAENVVAGNRVEYLPVSAAFESLALVYVIDGTAYSSRGARGTVKAVMSSYKIPVLQFKFQGFDTWSGNWGNPGVNFGAWKKPMVLSDANAGDIRLGGTYTAGVISGGVVLPSQGLDIDLANKLSHIKLLGGESIDIVERDPMGSMRVALSEDDEIAWRTDINNNVLASLGFNFGATAGQRVGIWCPAVQRVDPQAQDYEGRLLMQTELRILPSNGNDEIRIIAR